MRMQIVVYPACAGIDLNLQPGDRVKHCLPRMRGDRPCDKKRTDREKSFTPHARGSTSL